MRRHLIAIGTTAVLLFTVLGTARAQSSMRVISQVGGSTFGVAVQDGILYMGAGPRLLTVDVSEPSHPVVLDESEMLPSITRDVAVSEHYAYVCMWFGGVYVFNVSDPNHISQVGIYDEVVEPYDIEIAGNLALISDRNNGVHVVDISSPATPTQLAHLGTDLLASDTAILQNIAYIAAYAEGLVVFDLSNPSEPEFLTRLDTPKYARRVAVSGSYVYVADEDSLEIFDITIPEEPVHAGRWPSGANSVHLIGQHAYISSNNASFRVVDVSDPVSPQQVGYFSSPARSSHSESFRMCSSGSTLYLTAGGFGCMVADVSDPRNPTLAGHTQGHGLGSADLVSIQGEHAYTFKLGGELSVLNIADPTAPDHVQNFATDHFSADLETTSDYIYAATTDGLEIRSLADPTSPEFVGQFSLDNYRFGRLVELSGDIAFLVDQKGELNVINVSNPADPYRLGRWSGGEIVPRGLAVSGTTAYLHSTELGLVVIDASQYQDPVSVDQVGQPGRMCSKIIVRDHHLYTLYNYPIGPTFHAFDISAPLSPLHLAQLDPPGTDFTMGIAEFQGIACLAQNLGAFIAVDVSTPQDLRLIGTQQLPWYSRDVDMTDYIALVAQGDGGIVVVRIGDFDGDGVHDEDDNCSESVNPDQADDDDDNVGNACDLCPNSPPSFDVDDEGCTIPPPGDCDGDLDVDQEDFGFFQACLSGAGVIQDDPNCASALLDEDDDVDLDDFGIFQACISGPGVVADPGCIE